MAMSIPDMEAMSSIQALKTQDEKMSNLGLSKTTVNKDQVCCYSRDLGSASKTNPILVLLHGYPQSSYMWRHLIPLLPPSPLFVPDLPGYGASPPTPEMDKQTVGNAVMDALKTEVSRYNSIDASSDTIHIVLIGHDRGARVAHRLAVSTVPGVSIIGTCLIDIVPTSTQWQHYASPSIAAAEVTGYFHWPLLANLSLATRLITALGPGTFCTEMITRWAAPSSPSSPAFTSLSSDSALPLYAALFSQPGVLEATCADYAAGAGIDVEMQTKDQEEGKKMECPVLLVYSEKGIGKRFAFPHVWHEWVAEGVQVDTLGLGAGVGHFGAEEGPEVCAKAMGKWLEGLRGQR